MDTERSATQREYTTDIEPPLSIANSEAMNWDDEADLVTVGFGSAAAVAGIDVRENGGTVICVERFEGGGSTQWSGGVIYAGGGSHIQQEAGWEDDAEEMFKYLKFEGVSIRDDTLRRFCETSAANIEWLAGLGVPFDARFYPKRSILPPNGCLYFSGMEQFRDAAKTAPRGHKIAGKGLTGKHYWQAMREAALRSGIKLMQHSPVRRLVQDESGRIVGVECLALPAASWQQHMSLKGKVSAYRPARLAQGERAVTACRSFEKSAGGARKLIRARKGVLIATGNYTYNLGMLQKYTPALAEGYQEMMRTGDMGDDGSGVEPGQTVDGDVGNMDAAMVSRVISPPEEFYKGVLVNRAGKRMIHEDAYAGQVALPMLKEPGLAGWLVLDSKQFWKGIRQLLHPDNLFSWFGLAQWSNVLFGKTRRARTLAELAAKCGIDGDGLEATVYSYNTEPQTDPMLCHKLPENSAPIDKPPYFALDMALRNKANPSAGMPLGGLRVNEATGNVVRADGTDIPGLFAAGRAAVGISHATTFSGLTIADTIFAGRRAAKSILGGTN
ncbi:MAG: FAD-binding protein [Gammaproteobacteria bacterium]|nr:FAD-binding protein [Gammaproteobacteria bacterium]